MVRKWAEAGLVPGHASRHLSLWTPWSLMNNLELSGAFLGRGSQPSPVPQSPHDHAEVKGQGLGSHTQSWASPCLEELGHEEPQELEVPPNAP